VAREMGNAAMNEEIRRKVRVLQQLSIAAYPDAMLVYLCGMLMGAVHRVHFVRDLEGAPIAIQIAIGRARVWPMPPWQATVGGMTIPDPLTLASAIAQRDDPICVKLLFDGSSEHETSSSAWSTAMPTSSRAARRACSGPKTAWPSCGPASTAPWTSTTNAAV